jgi:hypothetical protein
MEIVRPLSAALLLVLSGGALATPPPAIQETVTTSSIPDAWGRVVTTTTVTEIYPDGSNPSRHERLTQTVTATYGSVDLANAWHRQAEVLCTQERLQQDSALVTATGLPQTDVTHYAAHRYDNQGRLAVQTVEPTAADCTNPALAQPAGRVVTAQDYYDFGAVRSRTLVSAQDVPPAQWNQVQSLTIYDATGTYAATQKNALDHQVTQVMDVATGTVTAQADANNLTRGYTYDHFGRVATETGADSVTRTTALAWCADVSCNADAEHVMTHLPTQQAQMISTR